MYDCLPEFIDAAYAKMAEEAGSGFDSRKYSLAEFFPQDQTYALSRHTYPPVKLASPPMMGSHGTSQRYRQQGAPIVRNPVSMAAGASGYFCFQRSASLVGMSSSSNSPR